MTQLKLRYIWSGGFFLITLLATLPAFSQDAEESLLSEPESVCDAAGAQFSGLYGFGNSCRNDCHRIGEGCGATMSSGCYCGPNKCFDVLSKTCLTVGSEAMIKARRIVNEKLRELAEKLTPTRILYVCNDKLGIEKGNLIMGRHYFYMIEKIQIPNLLGFSHIPIHIAGDHIEYETLSSEIKKVDINDLVNCRNSKGENPVDLLRQAAAADSR